MSKKPGVMIYFEILEMLKRMSLEEAGTLFIAILEYGQSGAVPELPDRLFIFWPLIQQRLDTDNARYREKAVQACYAADMRWAKERNQEVVPFSDWIANPKNAGKIDAIYES